MKHTAGVSWRPGATTLLCGSNPRVAARSRGRGTASNFESTGFILWRSPNPRSACGLLFVAAMYVAFVATAAQAAGWIERFRFHSPAVSNAGVAAVASTVLPRFTWQPPSPGVHIVRVSLPFPSGAFPAELGLDVESDGVRVPADVRILTLHPGRPKYARRAILTFPFEFSDGNPRTFELHRVERSPLPAPVLADGACAARLGSFDVTIDANTVRVMREGVTVVDAALVAPARTWSAAPATEIIEAGAHFLWARVLAPDSAWPRIIEVKLDVLGNLSVRAHLQRLDDSDEYAPEFGWRIAAGEFKQADAGVETRALPAALPHDFNEGVPLVLTGDAGMLAFPDAHWKRRGAVNVDAAGAGTVVTYKRSRIVDSVPQQHTAWRTAAFALSPSGASAWSPLLETGAPPDVRPDVYDAIYDSGTESDLQPWPSLRDAWQKHLDAIASSPAVGDDWGNVCEMPASGVYGMNRLNHCPPIFEAYYRTGDARLRAAALAWCNNFYNLSIWWGTHREDEFGGTRYNNRIAGTDESPNDRFMWRSDTAVHFCTKGYDSFFYAYEETGDPRMATALHWQLDYAGRMIRADRGECRNIGDALDYIRLFEFTGVPEHRDHALRLFRELRTRLSAGNLFSQGGRPIVDDPPFIDDDNVGYRHPFAKPYIIGYALAGLPVLAKYAPDEPKLRDVIRAVADFLADSQDPVGGWRYPHPRSSRVSAGQGMEHAAQLARAAAFLETHGEPVENLLDAIERVLQSRINTMFHSGSFFNGLGGWEQAAGVLKDGTTTYDLYERPGDRDPARDYTEGKIDLGATRPEGVVYFFEVLDFYLDRRPAERLLNANPPLQAILNRIGAPKKTTASADYRSYGMESQLPTFAAARTARLDFPLAWDPAAAEPFESWRERARARFLETLLTPPPRANFEPVVIGREDRDGYMAIKIVFNVSGDSRIPAYLLVPEGDGPFPAVLALHDHGAHFSIGKEKVVRPFDVSPDVLEDAREWVEKYYGGRFIGDELARRGFVVFAIDALFWGERGRREGVDFGSQQALAANLLQLGMTWSGVITWDDIRSAEFVASLPEVDPARIGALGLSMGAHRTWMLSAATDRIAAGAAICWLGTTEALMAPGNNQTKGHSAYSMLVPGLRNDLDYPDVASIACPKPMLFFNGMEDRLFPVPGVKDAYATLRAVWESRDVEHRLATRLWPVGHVFDTAMQEEAFAWLEDYLRSDKNGK